MTLEAAVLFFFFWGVAFLLFVPSIFPALVCSFSLPPRRDTDEEIRVVSATGSYLEFSQLGLE